MCSLPPPPKRSARHPVDVGLRTEAAIVQELLRLGYRVLQPLGFNHRYDLVIDCGDRFLRAQCKTGRLRRGAIVFATRSTRSSMTAISSRGYEGEVDLFLVHCAETCKVYAMPIEDARIGDCTLRVHPPRNGQAARIRWAVDYEVTGR